MLLQMVIPISEVISGTRKKMGTLHMDPSLVSWGNALT
uniref:Uncharacterized protein n=1 Tax=Rhizophora mucronata TaxID=61149 RepID=A0A2P2JQI7_RHIMU